MQIPSKLHRTIGQVLDIVAPHSQENKTLG
jgi:hypothetical protein